MKQALTKSPTVKAVKYVPDIRDIQVAGNVAYEWGYFDATQKSSDQQAPENLRAKLLRVMKRRPDGSWKFTRVMWLPSAPGVAFTSMIFSSRPSLSIERLNRRDSP